MKKWIISFILLFVLAGCSITDKSVELKSISNSGKQSTSKEINESTKSQKKPSDQTTFEEQLGEMLEEIDNLEFEKDDDGFPHDLK